MKIHVRRRHIVKGKPNSAEFCPLALAFSEVVGIAEGESAYVGPFRAQINRVRSKKYDLPRSARGFADADDFVRFMQDGEGAL